MMAVYLCCGSSTNGIPNSLLEFCSGPSSSSTLKPNSSNLEVKNVAISKQHNISLAHYKHIIFITSQEQHILTCCFVTAA
jgi:hypothetical protein